MAKEPMSDEELDALLRRSDWAMQEAISGVVDSAVGLAEVKREARFRTARRPHMAGDPRQHSEADPALDQLRSGATIQVEEIPDEATTGTSRTDLKARKGTRVTGEDRDTLAQDLRNRYEAGESIRALAISTGRSYGFVHRLLKETGVQLRSRGGATRPSEVSIL